MNKMAIFLIALMIVSVVFLSGCNEQQDNVENTDDEIEITGVEVLDYNGFTDNVGYTHVMGIVKNTGNTNVEFAKVKCSVYNSNNKLDYEDDTYVRKTVLTSGDTSFFYFIFDSYEVSDYHHCYVDILDSRKSDVETYDDIEIINHYKERVTGEVLTKPGEFWETIYINGTVKNTGNRYIEGVYISTIVYDEFNEIIGFKDALPSLDMSPGDIEEFSIAFFNGMYETDKTITSYDLEVEIASSNYW